MYLKFTKLAILLFFFLACTTVPKTVFSAKEPSKDSLALKPHIQRIKIATVVTENLDFSKELYREWLDHLVVDEGTVSVAMANSWGTLKMAGRPYAMLRSKSGDDVYLRLIEGNIPKNYQAMTTYGWNAIEIIVESPDAVYEKLIKSPFEHIGGPENLGGGLSTIRAVQFKGPSEEVFYFTTDTGDRSKSTLLTPRAPIDRPFIMVLAGDDVSAITNFYVTTFKAENAFFIKTPIPLIASAQNLPSTHEFSLGLLRLSAFSNSIEVDGYPPTAGPRPTLEGTLPAGVSITSFTITNLDLIDSKLFVSPPRRFSGIGYEGNRAVTIVGRAGELIELIEESEE